MTIRQQSALQLKLYKVIFGTETPAGKWFDIILIMIIVTSVAVIMLDSIADLHARYKIDDNARDNALTAARAYSPAADHAANAIVVYDLSRGLERTIGAGP